MHKGIRIMVKLWIEGEDEPAHNFAESTTNAVKEMLKTGQTLHPELKVQIRTVEEDTSYEEDPPS